MKIVGISMSLNKNNQYYVDLEYVKIIEKLGATPILLPFIENVENYIGIIDALILIGGHDVNPILYNEKADSLLGETLDIRDEFDSKLFRLAFDKNIPILGVCRGHQLINVLMGGTLYQDLSYKEGISINHKEGEHTIKQISGFLKNIYSENYVVNTIHHQAVKNVAKDFKVCAYSEDGVIEALEYTKDNRNVYTIQWHPELLANANDEASIRLFEFFLGKII